MTRGKYDKYPLAAEELDEADPANRQTRAILHLFRSLSIGKIVWVLGSGTSTSFGYPSWSKMISTLYDAIAEKSAGSLSDKEKLAVIESLLHLPGKYDAYKEALKAVFSRPGALTDEHGNLLPPDLAALYRAFGRETRVAPSLPSLRPCIDPLTRLHSDFEARRFLTYNYDVEIETLLEQYEYPEGSLSGGSKAHAESTGRHFEAKSNLGSDGASFALQPSLADLLLEFATFPPSDGHFVAHFHGAVYASETLVVTPREYNSTYIDPVQGREAFEDARSLIFSANAVIYVGVGMTEEDLLRPLRYLRLRAPANKIYALMPTLNSEEAAKALEHRLYVEYGITVIPYGRAAAYVPDAWQAQVDTGQHPLAAESKDFISLADEIHNIKKLVRNKVGFEAALFPRLHFNHEIRGVIEGGIADIKPRRRKIVASALSQLATAVALDNLFSYMLHTKREWRRKWSLKKHRDSPQLKIGKHNLDDKTASGENYPAIGELAKKIKSAPSRIFMENPAGSGKGALCRLLAESLDCEMETLGQSLRPTARLEEAITRESIVHQVDVLFHEGKPINLRVFDLLLSARTSRVLLCCESPEVSKFLGKVGWEKLPAEGLPKLPSWRDYVTKCLISHFGADSIVALELRSMPSVDAEFSVTDFCERLIEFIRRSYQATDRCKVFAVAESILKWMHLIRTPIGRGALLEVKELAGRQDIIQEGLSLLARHGLIFPVSDNSRYALHKEMRKYLAHHRALDFSERHDPEWHSLSLCNVMVGCGPLLSKSDFDAANDFIDSVLSASVSDNASLMAVWSLTKRHFHNASALRSSMEYLNPSLSAIGQQVRRLSRLRTSGYLYLDQLVWLVNELAVCGFVSGAYHDSLMLFREVLARLDAKPECEVASFRVRLNIAACLIERGHFRSAMDNCRRVLDGLNRYVEKLKEATGHADQQRRGELFAEIESHPELALLRMVAHVLIAEVLVMRAELSSAKFELNCAEQQAALAKSLSALAWFQAVKARVALAGEASVPLTEFSAALASARACSRKDLEIGFEVGLLEAQLRSSESNVRYVLKRLGDLERDALRLGSARARVGVLLVKGRALLSIEQASAAREVILEAISLAQANGMRLKKMTAQIQLCALMALRGERPVATGFLSRVRLAAVRVQYVRAALDCDRLLRVLDEDGGVQRWAGYLYEHSEVQPR